MPAIDRLILALAVMVAALLATKVVALVLDMLGLAVAATALAIAAMLARAWVR